MTFDYCQCCKINHENGRGHIYSKKHIKKLWEWSERQKKRVDDCLLLAQEGYANPSVTNHSFWCAFCGVEILDEAPMIVKNCLSHLCTKEHRDNVYAFFRKNGTNNKEIDQKWFYIGEPFRDEYVERCKSFIYHNKTSTSLFSKPAPICGPSLPSVEERKAQMNTAALPKRKPLKGVDAQLASTSYESLLDGPMQSDAFLNHQSFPTLQSRSGILQNASGFTETGRRVWGGGQVKVKESEWVAWPLDLLMLHVIRRRSQAQRAIHTGEAMFQQREAEKEAESRPVLVYTTHAAGEGLTCISTAMHAQGLTHTSLPSTQAQGLTHTSLPSTQAQGLTHTSLPSTQVQGLTHTSLPSTQVQGTIHTMALPPWLTQGEESRSMKQWKKQCEWEQRFNKRLRALDVGVVRGKKASADWLPNFGSVWESGSRHETRASFLGALQQGENARLYGRREEKKIGPESTLQSLNRLVKTGGEGLTEEQKQQIVDESKKALMAKIQIRMKE